jgi:hypothetical protein
MPSIHTFVVSWVGRHADAEAIAGAVQPQSDHTTVVYSDPDPDVAIDPSFDAVRRPDHLMFADKFQACLEHCKSDVLLLIHADARCESWPSVVEKCRDAFDRYPEVNVWAPAIDGTFFNVACTEISRLADHLSIVAGTDAIVVAFRRENIARFAECDLESNCHGWGIDWVLTCHSYANNMIAVVDRTIPVHHTETRSYNHDVAWQQMVGFLDGLTASEKALYQVLQGYIQTRTALSRAEKRNTNAVSESGED